MAFTNLVSRFDSISQRSAFWVNLWDAISIDRREKRSACFEGYGTTANRQSIKFDGVNIQCNEKTCSLLEVYGTMNSGTGFRFDAVNIDCCEKSLSRFNVYGTTRSGTGFRFDTICEWPLPYVMASCRRFDVLRPNPKAMGVSMYDTINERLSSVSPFYIASGRFDVPFDNLYRAVNRFDSRRDFESIGLANAVFDSIRDFASCDATPSRFNVYEYILWRDSWSSRFDTKLPNPVDARSNRFDVIARQILALPSRRQIFVKPGWTLFAKNIETQIVTPIGWIDAESETRSIEDVTLPEGDYEIIVTTSALFWKDAQEHVVRTISVREGLVFSQLPVIYNLRSAVSLGETTVRWSAGPSDVDDCVFGVWVSHELPIDTTVPPFMTIWYSNELTEYQANIQQRKPMYAAIAAIRTGNVEELGPVHTLHLPWSTTPPRAPDDAVVLPEPFSFGT